MAPPEVRVSGPDPALWDWDGPEQLILPGDKYSIDARQFYSLLSWIASGT